LFSRVSKRTAPSNCDFLFGEKKVGNVRAGINPGISHRLLVLLLQETPEFKHGILCDHKGESIFCEKSVPWDSLLFAPS